MAGFFDDPDDYSPEESVDAPPKPLAVRILGLTIKILFWSLILFMNGVILWRLFSSGDPSELKRVNADNTLKGAYADYIAVTHEPGDYFAFNQVENTRMNITDEDPDEETGFPGNYGYFAVSHQVIFPYAGQAQITFRYNLSTLTHLMEDYELPEVPDKSGDYYDVTLRVVMKDGTEKRIKPADVRKDTKSRYCYYGMMFKDLPSVDDVSGMFVDIYYIDDLDYTARPYGELCIYNAEYKKCEYKLGRKDAAALRD
ncbi:MAG: hypothetical protein MJ137_00625 [Clostridia bacterium]|nr:hypothetical protein [Clostridia bacterium]